MDAGLQYPHSLAPRGETVDEYPTADGGKETINDPYRFLENPDSEETKAWVAAQNQVTNQILETCPVRGAMNTKLTEVWNFSKTGALNKQGDFYYFNHNTGLQNQFVQYRLKEPNNYTLNQENPLEGTEVFLDPNTLSEDGTSALSTSKWSPDGKFFAYQIKVGGSDWATIYVRDAETCKDLDTDVLKWVKFSGMSWTKDNKGFFYSKFDAPEVLTKEGDTMDKAGTETEKLKN